jgi:ribosome-associated toxin RatA of RatAB toxin-antitoxin module
MTTTIKRSALVSYSARQMFELVNNIEDYPRFLPWCSKSLILKRTDTEVEASLEIQWKGIHKSFTTRNILHPFGHMEIELVSGPFRRLEGRWSFLELSGEACKVELDLEFELAGGIMDRVFEPIFNHIANSLVEAFCKRAVEVYGQS